MSKHRVAVLKVVSKQLSVTAAAAEVGISRQHLQHLLRRYRDGGLDALEPRSRRPHTSPGRIPDRPRRSARLGVEGHQGDLVADRGLALREHRWRLTLPIADDALIGRIVREESGPHSSEIGRINTEITTSSALLERVSSSSPASAPTSASRASTVSATVRERLTWSTQEKLLLRRTWPDCVCRHHWVRIVPAHISAVVGWFELAYGRISVAPFGPTS